MDKRKRKKRLLIALGVFGAFLILLVISAEVTSTSRFCNTCHYMKPFYQSWKTSSHNIIACSSCHYPPGIRSFFRAKFEGLMQLGRYWSKLYLKSKPWAEIPDESCLREGCHDKRLLQGRVKYNKVIFDHKVHLGDLKRGKKLRCTSCHSQIVQGEHITVTESTCFICHFKESEFYPKISDCSHCHHQDQLTSLESSRFNHSIVFSNGFKCDKCHSRTTIGDGAVPRENCFKCHFQNERLDKYGDTDLMHLNHISLHKIECNQCHLQIQHKIVRDIETLADCQTCHTGTHQAQKILYTGEGGKGTPHAEPNVMLQKGLSCKGCHIFHEETGGRLVKSGTFVSREMACESCHGKGFGKILTMWEASTGKKLDETKIVFEKTRREVSLTKSSQKARAEELLNEAAFNIDIVERGKSVHNVAYSQELLLTSFSKLEEALRLIGSGLKPGKLSSLSDMTPNQCSVCHAGIEEISTQVFGLRFSHETHLIRQKMACATCHSNIKQHGEFIASKQTCAPCHHKDIKKNCGTCHELQKTVYEGGTIRARKIESSAMAQSGVECVGCHEGAPNQIFRSDGQKCADCHDKTYAEMHGQWQASFKESMSALKSAINSLKNRSLSQDQKDQIQKIEQVIQILDLDGSRGVHNSIFNEEALTSAKKMLDSIGKSGPNE